MCNKNPLEIFPYGAPALPIPWKIRQIDPLPPGKSDPFCGGGYEYFLELHITD